MLLIKIASIGEDKPIKHERIRNDHHPSADRQGDVARRTTY